MDAELLRTNLSTAQKGEHVRRLMAMEEWGAVDKEIKTQIKKYDTVKGIRADKEFLIRQSKVDALEELLGSFKSIQQETETALEELNTRDDYDA